MERLSPEEIRTAWDQLGELSEKETQQLAQRMQKEQPYIMVYILAAEESIAENKEPGWLIEKGAMIWYALSQTGQKLRPVTGDELDQADAANEQYLEQLEAGSEMDWTAGVTNLMQSYNQAPLLGMVLELLMAGQEETPELAGDEVGLGLICLKTVIDCLDQ